MTDFRVDDAGQIIGVDHHDGRLRSVVLRDEEIDLGLVTSAGQNTQVTLTRVKYFALNNLREGNIVDWMYLWDLERAPEGIARRLRQALNMDSATLLSGAIDGASKVFHLECSYGAELFAVVEGVRINACAAAGVGAVI